eukprot:gnl/TRDRNA2_/TRDRNA2_154929_c0_seq1.p1 gnl/TRDRNA2_/TRDRNA2_154929_c0~~gnl/TRDRNA2_/TRDRNA2_154929_c0_seq1.p1  ORF type:complete len:301 (+),score=57.20 gnl/TRDRNA2_/TRDRNA2_154929_c0_seq1:49-951(+)
MLLILLSLTVLLASFVLGLCDEPGTKDLSKKKAIRNTEAVNMAHKLVDSSWHRRDELHHSLVDNLFDRAINAWPQESTFQPTHLDDTVLGKAANLVLPSSMNLRAVNPLRIVSARGLPLRAQQPREGFQSQTAFQNAARHGQASGEAPSRRQLLWLLGPAASGVFPRVAVADETDAAKVAAASSKLKAIVSNINEFTTAVASEAEDVKLPAQISFRTFQALAKSAHNVEGQTTFEPTDYLEVAAEYAEHAGAARDFFKLSKLGRAGENGSQEVAMDYAKRCGEELQAASALLDVLSLAVQ